MKALTIWQPWASLVIAGAKPFEFRSWKPPAELIGRRIVIHASVRPTNPRTLHHMLEDLEAGGDRAAHHCIKPDIGIPIVLKARWGADALPLGAGIGTAIVGNPRRGCEVFRDFGGKALPAADSVAAENWAWPLLEIVPWEAPVPMKGAQRLWNWPDSADERD